MKLPRDLDGSIITLTTDFGTTDWFAGVVKGVIARYSPARVIDITHEIPPGNILAGAYVLAQSYRYFPERTVHLAIVDPGVGGRRAAIAVETSRYFFVGPDNGILSLALRQEKVQSVRRVENRALFLQPPSRTFHGRDIFAPIAAFLSNGGPIQQVGPTMRSICKLRWPQPKRLSNGWRGEVIYIDRFGNALTNLSSTLLDKPTRGRVRLPSGGILKIAASYDSGRVGAPLALIGSTDCLEIALREGRASDALNLRTGDRIELLAAFD